MGLLREGFCSWAGGQGMGDSQTVYIPLSIRRIREQNVCRTWLMVLWVLNGGSYRSSSITITGWESAAGRIRGRLG